MTTRNPPDHVVKTSPTNEPTSTDTIPSPRNTRVWIRTRWLLASWDNGDRVYAALTACHHGRPAYAYVSRFRQETEHAGATEFSLIDALTVHALIGAKRYSSQKVRHAHSDALMAVRDGLGGAKDADVLTYFQVNRGE